MCGSPLAGDTLCKLGATLGADIPFCLVGGTAIATGIGDILTSQPPMPQVSMVVACQGEGVSTPVAYAELDKRYHDFTTLPERKQSPELLIRLLGQNHSAEAAEHFFNIFEEIILKKQPYVSVIKAEMLRCGAVCSMMSGSGPSVFGIFRTGEDAERAYSTLLDSGAAAFVCHPCGENHI